MILREVASADRSIGRHGSIRDGLGGVARERFMGAHVAGQSDQIAGQSDERTGQHEGDAGKPPRVPDRQETATGAEHEADESDRGTEADD